MNLLIPDHYQSTQDPEETEERLQAPFRRKQIIKNLFLNLELSRKEMFLLQNSEDTTTEVICRSESTTKTLFPSLYGRFQSNHLTIITICLSFLMDRDKNLTLTGHLLFLEHMTYWKREETRFCLSFLN